MIIYDKLFILLEAKGWSKYKIRQENLIGQGTLTALRHGGHLNAKTINKICNEFGCQPGDIMEHIPDLPQNEK